MRFQPLVFIEFVCRSKPNTTDIKSLLRVFFSSCVRRNQIQLTSHVCVRSGLVYSGFSFVYARVNETVRRGGFFDETRLSELIKERKYNYSHVFAAAFQREIVQDVSIVQKQ